MLRLCDDHAAMAKEDRARVGGAEPLLRKRFGQHHLIRGELCDPLVRFLEPDERLVVEIGPGGGVLTERLAASGARVVAVEVDLDWALILGQRADWGATRVIVGDALEIEWERLPGGTLVAGNLPFNVSTVIIERVLRQWPRVPRAGFLVQKEVADRLLARPGEEAYGALSVITAARSRPMYLGLVRRGSFRPPPKVDGAFVGLELIRPTFDEAEMDRFVATVHLAFSQRRKQLRNALGAGWGREEAGRAIAAAGIDPHSRAEQLCLADFIALHRGHRSPGAS